MPWNFAYGSNMHPGRLRGRAHGRPTRSEAAVLPDWRLAFNLATGLGWAAEPAMANIVPAKGDSVHGVALELTDDELDRLIRSEGGDRFYRPTMVSLRTYGGASLTAFAFVARPEVVRDEVPPSQRYLRLLQDGARHHALDATYRARLERHPAREPGWWSPWMSRLFYALDQPRAHRVREGFMWSVHQGAQLQARRARRRWARSGSVPER